MYYPMLGGNLQQAGNFENLAVTLIRKVFTTVDELWQMCSRGDTGWKSRRKLLKNTRKNSSRRTKLRMMSGGVPKTREREVKFWSLLANKDAKHHVITVRQKERRTYETKTHYQGVDRQRNDIFKKHNFMLWFITQWFVITAANLCL